MNLGLRPLMVIEAEVAAPVSMGDPGGGVRRFVPITGGRVTGAVEGKVLPGADWQTVLPDGTIELFAHYALETVTGARLEVTSTGVRSGPPEVMERLGRGEAVDPQLYYFRTAMRFRTGAPEFSRLNTVLGVSVAERQANLVTLTVYEVE
jgi:hypothetical protein